MQKQNDAEYLAAMKDPRTLLAWLLLHRPPVWAAPSRTVQALRRKVRRLEAGAANGKAKEPP